MPKIKTETQLRASLTKRLEWALERLKASEMQVALMKRHVQGLREVLATLSDDATSKLEQTAFRLALKTELAIAPKTNRLAHMTIRDAVRAVLTGNENQPMRVREILIALENGGRQVGGKKSKDTLRAILRNYENDFHKLDDGKWMLVTSASPTPVIARNSANAS